jgi:chromosome segregation ATPase
MLCDQPARGGQEEALQALVHALRCERDLEGERVRQLEAALRATASELSVTKLRLEETLSAKAPPSLFIFPCKAQDEQAQVVTSPADRAGKLIELEKALEEQTGYISSLEAVLEDLKAQLVEVRRSAIPSFDEASLKEELERTQNLLKESYERSDALALSSHQHEQEVNLTRKQLSTLRVRFQEFEAAKVGADEELEWLHHEKARMEERVAQLKARLREMEESKKEGVRQSECKEEQGEMAARAALAEMERQEWEFIAQSSHERVSILEGELRAAEEAAAAVASGAPRISHDELQQQLIEAKVSATKMRERARSSARYVTALNDKLTLLAAEGEACQAQLEAQREENQALRAEIDQILESHSDAVSRICRASKERLREEKKLRNRLNVELSSTRSAMSELENQIIQRNALLGKLDVQLRHLNDCQGSGWHPLAKHPRKRTDACCSHVITREDRL